MPIVGLLPGVGRLVINGETQGLLRTNYIMHTVLYLHTVDLREFLKPLTCDFREGVSPTTLAVL